MLLILVGVGIGARWLHRLGESGKVKFVGVAFAMHLRHDVLVVVVPQRTTQFVVVHVGFRFAFAPTTGHFVRVHQLEFAVRALPDDAIGITRVGQEFKEKLPQLDLPRACKERDGGALERRRRRWFLWEMVGGRQVSNKTEAENTDGQFSFPFCHWPFVGRLKWLRTRMVRCENC